MSDFAIVVISLLAGAIASVTGFGIGSLITPALSLVIGTKLAVATVAAPHFIATVIRFWMLRGHLDKQVFLSFGLMSAAGGFLGALLYAIFATPALTLIFGCVLIFAGFMGSTNLSQKLRFHGAGAWIAGGVSGLFGGMVGNQGGIRSAALLGFNIPKESFVATATAVGLVVDGFRIPVYFWNQGYEVILGNAKWFYLTTVGVVIGTLLGARLLRHLNDQTFYRLVSGFIFLLGIFMFYQGL
jgi:uncharacterized membrane protein YfcA